MFNEQEYRKIYNKLNAKKRNAYSKKYYWEHKEVVDQKNRIRWQKNHPPRILLTQEEKTKRMRTSREKWKKNNPEKLLLSSYRHYNEKAKKVNLSGIEYRWCLYYWGKTVKKLANNTCQICDKPAEHAHHIFPKARFPKLTFNINNGIALCSSHHKEIHRRSW